jgi:hypothetical protein
MALAGMLMGRLRGRRGEALVVLPPPGDEVVQRQSGGVVKALGQVAAQMGDRRGDRGRFHAFGEHPHLEAVGEANDGRDNLPVPLGLRRVAHEALVNLYFLDGQALQVAHPRVAGAEIVDGQIDAQGAQALQHFDDGFGLLDHRCFGEFQAQAGGGNGPGGEALSHEIGKFAIQQVVGGQIDGQAEGDAGAGQALLGLHGLLQQPAVEDLAQPQAFDAGQDAGRDFVQSVLAREAQQGFSPDAGAAGQVDLRLKVQREPAAVGKGVAQLGVQGVLIAAGLFELGPVEGVARGFRCGRQSRNAG